MTQNNYRGPIRTVFALTGGIASGKSTVGKVFADQGIPVIDADQISREVLMPGEGAYHYTVGLLTDAILNADGTIDRKKLGAKMFSSKRFKRFYEKKMWEYILLRSYEKFEPLKGLVCYEASMIMQATIWAMYRPLVVVQIEPQLQLERLMVRNSLTEKEALARIRSQSPHVATLHADYLIRNDGDLDSLKQKALSCLDALPFLQRCMSGT